MISHFDKCNKNKIKIYYESIYRNFENDLPGGEVKKENFDIVNTQNVTFPIFSLSIRNEEKYETKNIWKPLFYAIQYYLCKCRSNCILKKESLEEKVKKLNVEIEEQSQLRKAQSNNKNQALKKFGDLLNEIKEVFGTQEEEREECKNKINEMNQELEFYNKIIEEMSSKLKQDEILNCQVQDMNIETLLQRLITKYQTYMTFLKKYEDEVETDDYQYGANGDYIEKIIEVMKEKEIYENMYTKAVEKIKCVERDNLLLRKDILSDMKKNISTDMLKDFEHLLNTKKESEILVDENTFILSTAMELLKKESRRWVEEIIGWEKVTDAFYGKNEMLMDTKLQGHYIESIVETDRQFGISLRREMLFTESQKKKIMKKWQSYWKKYCDFIGNSNLIGEEDELRKILQIYIQGLEDIVKSNNDLSTILDKMESQKLATIQKVDHFLDRISAEIS